MSGIDDLTVKAGRSHRAQAAIDPRGIDESAEQPSQHLFNTTIKLDRGAGAWVNPNEQAWSGISHVALWGATPAAARVCVSRRDLDETLKFQSKGPGFFVCDVVNAILNSSSPDNPECVEEIEPQPIDRGRRNRPSREPYRDNRYCH